MARQCIDARFSCQCVSTPVRVCYELVNANSGAWQESFDFSDEQLAAEGLAVTFRKSCSKNCGNKVLKRQVHLLKVSHADVAGKSPGSRREGLKQDRKRRLRQCDCDEIAMTAIIVHPYKAQNKGGTGQGKVREMYEAKKNGRSHQRWNDAEILQSGVNIKYE